MSVWCLQPEIRKVIHKCVWPSFSRSTIEVMWLILGLFSEILDLVNVGIDTKIKSVACIQPEIRKVIQWMCVTFSFKVNRQGHMIFFNIFDIHDLENVRIDTKINFVSCLQPEIRKVMQKGVWPWFSKSCNKDRIFSLSPLDSLTPKKHTHEKYFQKIRTWRQKSRGLVSTLPLGRPKVDFYLGHLRVKTAPWEPPPSVRTATYCLLSN